MKIVGNYLRNLLTVLITVVGVMFVIQLIQHHTRNLTWPVALPILLKAIFYAGLLISMAFFSVRESVEFIYFQF